MPLPIALGGRSISAQTLDKSCGRPDSTDDGARLLKPQPLYESVGWAVCPSHEWSARVICTYYDLVVASDDENLRDCTMVEVRIQLSPLARPLSTDYRETTHHLKLLEEEGTQLSIKLNKRQPQVFISSDRRNLAVLLSHPHQACTALVIFQLRKPRADLSAAVTQKNPIPVPSYIQRVGTDGAGDASVMARDPPAVATHPRFVPVWGITTVACLSPDVNPSVFVAVRHDGSFVWLDARSSLTVAIGHLDFTSEQKDEWLPVSTLRVSPSSEMNQGEGVMITRNGNLVAVQWDLKKNMSQAKQPTFTRSDTGVVVACQLPAAPPSAMLSPNRSMNHGVSDMISPMRKIALSKSSDLADMIAPMRKMALSKSSDLADMLSPGMRNALRLQRNKNEGEGGGVNQRRKLNFDPKDLKGPTKTSTSGEGKLNHDMVTVDTTKYTPSMSTEEPVTSSVETQLGAKSNVQSGRQVEPLKRQMSLRVLSVLNDGAIRDAQYTRIPSVLCLLYDPDIFTGKVARICSLHKGGSIKGLVDLVLTEEQLTQACRLQSCNLEAVAGPEIQASPKSRHGLDYDESSDTFAISAFCRGTSKWFGCLWNWRHNILGWTIQKPIPEGASNTAIWNRLYFCRYPQKAHHLAVLESFFTKGQHTHVRKEVVAVGILSPRSQVGDPQLEPNSLLLASDSVHLPEAIPAFGPERFELKWKIAALPTNYRNTYGPPGLAACGRRFGNSIAVASSCGLCILDRQSRWRHFGTPSEEKSFQVLGMAWWEGTASDQGPEESTEDLLLAIIQSDNGRQYLSCWSSKRLDLAHQLLVDYRAITTDDNSSIVSWGIPLDRRSERATLSLLSEPYSTKRRGVVLLTYPTTGTHDFDYQVYRLQTQKADWSPMFTERLHESMPYVVRVQELLHGSVAKATKPASALWSTFLAGASFDFDLELDDYEKLGEEDMVATIGVVRCPGGLDAVALLGRKTYSDSVLNHGETTKVSMCDIVCSSRQHTAPNSANHSVDAFVWKVELLTGETYCWMVPNRIHGEATDIGTRQFPCDEVTPRLQGLCPPMVVGRHKSARHTVGILCRIGASSSWMQQSSLGTQSDATLGGIPDSGFGCILRAGQHVRVAHCPGLSGNPESELYEPRQLQMLPPAFLPSIYMFLLEAAHLRVESVATQEVQVGGTSTLQGFERICVSLCCGTVAMEDARLILPSFLHSVLKSTSSFDYGNAGIRMRR
jgi:hypothetical protein